MLKTVHSAVVRGGLAVAFLLGASLTALAQPPEVKPGPEHKVLGRMIGSWDATTKMGDIESKGTMVFRWGPGRLWVLSEFRGDFGGMKFEGRGMSGFDPVKKKYVGVWIDSMSTSLMTSEGTYDEASKVFTEYGEGIGPDGKPSKSKMVTEMKDKDSMVFKMYEVKDGQENLMMTIEYKRQPPKPKAPAPKKADAAK